jgi:hypothetical protein
MLFGLLVYLFTQFCQLLERILSNRLLVIIILEFIKDRFVLNWLLLHSANSLLVIMQQLINLLDLLTHFLHLSVFSILLFFGALISDMIVVLFLIFWFWRLLAFLKDFISLTLIILLRLTNLFSFLLLFWLRRVVPKSRLITCNKLAP